jgi:enoyl-CoA hydratase/carnithine racemase
VDYDSIVVSEDSGVATVMLNRPERLNAFTARMGIEVRHAITHLDARDDIRVIILTGAGRAFTAGSDLEPPGGESPEVLRERYRPATEREYFELATPLIAAIQGSAVGIGLTLPVQFDFRIMAEKAKFGFVFTRRGLPPELGSSWMLPRLIGLTNTLDVLLTGRLFDGTEALRLGLATEVQPNEDVLPRAQQLARDIATNVAPVAAAMTKRLVYGSLRSLDRPGQVAIENELFQWALSNEGVEGVQSFFQKREPKWPLGKNSDFPHEIFARGDSRPTAP